MSRARLPLRGCSLLLVAASCWLAACQKPLQLGTAPRIVIPLEPEPKKETPPPPAAAPPPAAPAEVEEHEPPDPPAARHREQVRLQLLFSEGMLSLTHVEAIVLPQPRLTPRRMGRFSAELWRGGVLIERLRFDFPLLAGGDDDGVLEAGLRSQVEIMLPSLERPTSLRLLDRRTRHELLFSWPLPVGDVAPASRVNPGPSSPETTLPVNAARAGEADEEGAAREGEEGAAAAGQDGAARAGEDGAARARAEDGAPPADASSAPE